MWILIVLLMNCLMLAAEDIEKYFGELSSPGYPFKYPPDTRMTWNISVPSGFTIKIQFIDLHTEESEECTSDFVMLTSGSEHIVTLCGSTGIWLEGPTLPALAEYTTQSNAMTVIFQSGQNNEFPYRGFIAYYTAEDIDECSGKINNHSSCQHYCHNYPGGFRCSCSPGYRLASDKRSCEHFLKNVSLCSAPKVLPNGYLVHRWSMESGTHESIIQYHCNKHYEMVTYNDNNGIYTCRGSHHWQDVNGYTKIPDCLPICGKPVHAIENYRQVLSMTDAPAESFPWQSMVRIGRKQGAGTLINDQWILTAAHIIYPKGSVWNPNITAVQDIIVHLGKNDIANFTKPLEVESVFVNPHFRENPHNFDSDIALIKLKQKVFLTDNLLPICLPSPYDEHFYETNQVGFISSWRKLKNEISTSKLKYIGLPIINLGNCSNFLQYHKAESTILVLSEDMFCAGFMDETVDPCHFNGGTGFIVQENDTWVLAGIVSKGTNCGKPGHYGLFTKVSQYINWISGIISRN
ncbi:complement C1r subcomponent-like isoform X2 [Protopterus annectens]|uniref:complement C1r subcomponent-like isoform X2 n=1 Tax=Protopterus annectens TaxID=7888 RepID=UPI001CFC4435|nr:complement C1r subcomponent-like isoform X2 [Protopterus annectens]